MKEIPLTQGKVALVDDEDYERVSTRKWSAFSKGTVSNIWYATTFVPKVRNKTIYMHRFIMDAPGGVQVDHINGDGLDNRRGNLRLVTNRQNIQNSSRHRDNSAGLKGVFISRNHKRWCSGIRHNDKHVYIGTYDTVEEAGRAYDAKAREFFGEFAKTNFPVDQTLVKA